MSPSKGRRCNPDVLKNEGSMNGANLSKNKCACS